MKKTSKKKNSNKALKIIVCIIIAIVVIFIIHIIRNYLIITNLQNKTAQYTNSTNYCIKSIANENNGTIIAMKYYKKGNKQVIFLARNVDGKVTNMKMYNNGERTDTFIETTDSKIAKLNSGTIMSININNYLATDNNIQTLMASTCAKIKSTNYNGQSCYQIKNFMPATSLEGKEEGIYINKDTGLVIRLNENGTTTYKEFEFNNVNDLIFVEPDISQYTLK